MGFDWFIAIPFKGSGFPFSREWQVSKACVNQRTNNFYSFILFDKRFNVFVIASAFLGPPSPTCPPWAERQEEASRVTHTYYRSSETDTKILCFPLSHRSVSRVENSIKQ